MGNEPRTPGAIPVLIQSSSGTQPHRMDDEPMRPRTWQVIAGFLGAAAILTGGMWTIANTVFLDKETYLREQRVQAELNADFKNALKQNLSTVDRLEAAVDKLVTAVADLPRRR